MKTEQKRSRQAKIVRDYAHFLGQLELVDVRLVSAKMDNFAHTLPPSDARITVRARPWYENAKGRIDMFHRYNLTVLGPQMQNPAAKLSAVFCTTYSSEIPMNDEIFNIFRERSLPVITWPYFREFVHNTFGRAGWIGLVAPAYKRGVEHRKAT